MALIVAIVCIGIPGNAFVIYVFGWRKKTKMNMKERGRRDRNRFEFLLLLLSCIDLISLLLVPPIFFYLTMAKFKVWHFGKVACKIVPSLLQITISLSQGMLVCIPVAVILFSFLFCESNSRLPPPPPPSNFKLRIKYIKE